MGAPTVLEQIAAKEQELRVQLMSARAHADALVAGARKEIGESREAEERTATDETEDWLSRDADRARDEAEQLISQAAKVLKGLVGKDARRDAAVQQMLDEILLRLPQPRS